MAAKCKFPNLVLIGLLLFLISSCDNCENPPNHKKDTTYTANGEDPIGGGIANIGNTCYMNAVLQIIKAVYPDAFDRGTDNLSQAGKKLMDALDEKEGVGGDIARNFSKLRRSS